MKKPTRKDLPPKSPTHVKGGKIAINDNITLVRGALVAIVLAAGVVVTAAQPEGRSTATGATFTFTGASETFVVPHKVDVLLVEVWGAGGGGGASIPGFNGQGGGGGGYARSLVSAAAGDELTITVGGGGVAGPVGSGGFGFPDGGEGQNGQGGGGGGGGATLVVIPGVVALQGCGGGGGGFNVGGSGQGATTGGGHGGSGSVCHGLMGQPGTGFLGGDNPAEGSIFRGSAGAFVTPGLGANGGTFLRSIASGGFGFEHSQPRPAEDGKPGLVRITYY